MKKKATVFVIAGILTIGIIALILFSVNAGKDKGYRMMQVYQIEGNTTIERENVGTMDAYENLNLISGDKVKVSQNSYMRLKVDEDKYILAEENSIFYIYATGTKKGEKTDIQLERGSITVEVQNKLADVDSFEVTTPNSVMAVRGTVFRIGTDVDENGETITKIAILEGSVSVQKRDENGKLSDKQIVDSGTEAIVYKDANDLQIQIVDEMSTIDIPVEVLEFLQEIIENGRELTLDSEEIKELIEQLDSKEITELENYTVSFMYHGNVFATQTVEEGGKAVCPMLSPAPSGRWNFDFSESIYEDIEIEFVE